MTQISQVNLAAVNWRARSIFFEGVYRWMDKRYLLRISYTFLYPSVYWDAFLNWCQIKIAIIISIFLPVIVLQNLPLHNNSIFLPVIVLRNLPLFSRYILHIPLPKCTDGRYLSELMSLRYVTYRLRCRTLQLIPSNCRESNLTRAMGNDGQLQLINHGMMSIVSST